MGKRRENPTYYEGDLRADLMNEALHIIEEEGTAAVHLRALCRRLGVSHAAPANHFPNKATLFTEIAREGFIALHEALRTAEQGASNPSDRLGVLEGIGLAYLDFAATHPGHFAVMFRRHLYDPSEVTAEATAAIAVLHEVVRQAQKAGWHGDADCQELVTFLWSVVHGYAHLESEGALAATHQEGRAQILRLSLQSGWAPDPH